MLSFTKTKGIELVDTVLRVFIFMLIVALLLYAFFDVLRIWQGIGLLSTSVMLHDVAFFLVLVKAYNILLSYLERGHVSVRYIIEIVIIASFIEVIFAFGSRDLSSNIFLGAFGLLSLLVYLVFSQRIPQGKGRK
jgi:uncharacterized membrane protein (DUF373 family)